MRVSQGVDVLVLAAAEHGAAVHHRHHRGGEGGGPQPRQQVQVDEDARQHGRLGQRRVQLREVEEQPEEHERDAEHEDAEDGVEGEEALAPLPQDVGLLGRALGVADLVTHVAQRLQLGRLAAVEAHGRGEGADAVHEAAGEVQPQQLERDRVEDDDDRDGHQHVLLEEYCQQGDGDCAVEDGEGVEGERHHEAGAGEPPLLALVEVHDGLQQREEGGEEAGQLHQAPVPPRPQLQRLELRPLLRVRRGEVVDPLGQRVDQHAVPHHHQVEDDLARRRDEALEAAEVHGLPPAGGVAGAEGHHDDGEQRVDHQVDPVGGVPAAAALVQAALVHLGQDGHEDGGDDQHQGEAAPCNNTQH